MKACVSWLLFMGVSKGFETDVEGGTEFPF